MKKSYIIIASIVALLILFGAGGYILSRNSQKAIPSPTDAASEDTGRIETIHPSDIGLKMIPLSNNKQVKVIVADVSDIDSLEYEITYEADIPTSERIDEGMEDRTTRGFSEIAEIKSSDTKYESKVFDLGSCSRNICRYDTGVASLDLIMKVTKKDGNIFQVEDSLKL